jgi:hypothetical protein
MKRRPNKKRIEALADRLCKLNEKDFSRMALVLNSLKHEHRVHQPRSLLKSDPFRFRRTWDKYHLLIAMWWQGIKAAGSWLALMGYNSYRLMLLLKDGLVFNADFTPTLISIALIGWTYIEYKSLAAAVARLP